MQLYYYTIIPRFSVQSYAYNINIIIRPLITHKTTRRGCFAPPRRREARFSLRGARAVDSSSCCCCCRSLPPSELFLRRRYIALVVYAVHAHTHLRTYTHKRTRTRAHRRRPRLLIHRHTTRRPRWRVVYLWNTEWTNIYAGHIVEKGNEWTTYYYKL